MSEVDVDVDCHRPGCQHPYRRHAPGGAHCRVCDCAGFRWVDVDGPAVGSYAEPPGAPLSQVDRHQFAISSAHSCEHARTSPATEPVSGSDLRHQAH